MYCQNCNREKTESEVFCGECGTRLVKKASDNSGKSKTNQTKYMPVILITCICIFVLIVGVLLCDIFLSEDAKRYNEAVDMLNNGNYEESMMIFDSLDGFRDSRNYYSEARKKAISDKLEKYSSNLEEIGDFILKFDYKTEDEEQFYEKIYQTKDLAELIETYSEDYLTEVDRKKLSNYISEIDAILNDWESQFQNKLSDNHLNNNDNSKANSAAKRTERDSFYNVNGARKQIIYYKTVSIKNLLSENGIN